MVLNIFFYFDPSEKWDDVFWSAVGSNYYLELILEFSIMLYYFLFCSLNLHSVIYNIFYYQSGPREVYSVGSNFCLRYPMDMCKVDIADSQSVYYKSCFSLKYF